MTMAEERPYHHGNLSAALVDAGLELAAEGGPDAVVLREVARRVGVSPTAAYRHFENQAALNEAIKLASLDRLATRMRTALADFDSQAASGALPGGVRLPGIAAGSHQERALRRAETLARAYFDFAVERAGLFRCFCIGVPSSADTALKSLADDPAFSILNDVLDELVDAGVLTSERRSAGVDVALWAAVHGLSVLCLDGPLAEASRAEQHAMLAIVIDVLFRGMAGT